MITIIKSGKKREDLNFMAKCQKCSCLFKFQEGDYHLSPSDGTVAVLACPDCSYMVSSSLNEARCE